MQFIKVCNYDFNMKLSEHFTLGEFIQSSTAYKSNMFVQYVHQQPIVDNLQFLVNKLLEPARCALGAPITVTSGYRCRGLNSAVGGATNSLHLHGLAADITAGRKNQLLIEILREMDFHELRIYKNYIHVSIKQLWNAHRVTIAK